MREMIKDSPHFKAKFGEKNDLIIKLLPMFTQDMLDKMHAFLVLESNQK